MKKILIMTLAFVGFSMGAMAQNEEKECCGKKVDKTEMIKQRTDRFVERYGLDQLQAEQLLALNTKYADKMPRMHKPNGKGDMNKGQDMRRKGGSMDGNVPQPPVGDKKMDDKRKEMEADREAYQKELKKILTKEQYAKFEADRKEHADKKGRKDKK